jgi:hypothetical protein
MEQAVKKNLSNMKWINVNDRLPKCKKIDIETKRSKTVLCLFKDNNVMSCRLWFILKDGSYEWDSSFDGEDFTFDSITHWMKIPKKPVK